MAFSVSSDRFLCLAIANATFSLIIPFCVNRIRPALYIEELLRESDSFL